MQNWTYFMKRDDNSDALLDSPVDADRRGTAIDKLHNATAIYTAEPIVDDLLTHVNWPNGRARLIDPSCGDGMFLGRALTKALTMHSFDDHDLPLLMEGWEIHAGACSQAKARLEAILIAHGRSAAAAFSIASQLIHNRDFLTEAPRAPTWDAVVGNPPYLRWVNVPELLREEYAHHVPSYAAGDMLHAFLDRCAQIVRPEGQVAFVVSDRWLSAVGSSKMREHLGRDLSIQYLERIDVNTAFYRPKSRRAGSPPRIHPVAIVLSNAGATKLTSDPIYPGSDDARYDSYPTLGEIAKVRIAPWLGTDGVFVLSKQEALESRIPQEYLIPAVDTDDIKDGILGEPSRFAIITRPGETPCREIIEHLQRNMWKMSARGAMAGPYMPPESFHRFDISQPALIVPRIVKNPRVVRIPAGVLPINHNLSVVSGPPEVLDRIEAAFSSPIAADWMKERAPRLENGYFSLITTQIRKLPIAV